MRYLVTVIAALTLSACALASGPENAFYFYDKQLQTQLIDQLKREKFPFHVDDEGRIRYPARRETAFSSIRDEFLQSRFRPSFSFEKNEYNQILADRLKQAGIAYQMEERNGRVWVRWNDADDSRARKIRDQLLESVGSTPR